MPFSVCRLVIVKKRERVWRQVYYQYLCRDYGQEDTFYNSEVIRDLNEFKERADVIVANRFTEDLEDVEEKVYTRDLYHSN